VATKLLTQTPHEKLNLTDITQSEDSPSSPNPFSHVGRRGARLVFLVPLALNGRGARGKGLEKFCVR